MIFCKNIQGSDYVFDVTYRVKSWHEPACRDYDEQPFKFELLEVFASLDEPQLVFRPATAWLQEQIEDDPQLAEEIEFDAYDWLVVQEDEAREAEEARNVA